MSHSQLALLLFNALGGAAVIGSYVHGLLAHPNNGAALWGGVSESVRPLYSVSMLLATVGYLAAISYLLFRREAVPGSLGFGLGAGWLWLSFALILLPSALWMPLTWRVIDGAGDLTALWWAIQLVLALVALGGLGLVVLLAGPAAVGGSLHRWLALAGAVAFFLHVAVLDAALWPVLFRSS